jgi:16S rRNA (adenine1518-N6/adenine1519-N6)-dimethyltransferase
MQPLPAAEIPSVDAEAFSRVVAAAFGQRRKTLRNALATLLDVGAIATAGVDPQVRAETLANDAFVRLARQLVAAGSPGVMRATG